MGAVVQSYEFNEHGIPMPGSGSGTGTFSPKTYQGGLSVNDDRNDSGLYLMGHRHYAAELGRFISRDPIGFAGGLNLFNGAATNPVTFVDPSGMGPVPTEACENYKAFKKKATAEAAAAAEAMFERTKNKYGVYTAEVLISDPIDTWTGQWGHAAISLEGTVFSQGQKGVWIGAQEDYIGIQRDLPRTTHGYWVGLNESQYKAALQEAYLNAKFRNPKIHDILYSNYGPFNQCTTGAAGVLTAAGVDVTDPNGGIFYPGDLESALRHSPDVVARTTYRP
jgi:RHS repeat-associated protein